VSLPEKTVDKLFRSSPVGTRCWSRRPGLVQELRLPPHMPVLDLEPAAKVPPVRC